MGISAKIKMGRKVRKKSQILSDLGNASYPTLMVEISGIEPLTS